MDRLLSEQEVKKWLERWIGYLDEDMIYRMKIGTRNIPSAELCEDAISRDAVLEKAVYTETEEGWSGYTVDVDYIKSLPSVKPQESKTGHWIELGCVGNDNYDFECSECHHTDTQSKTVKVNYCWYCGAKMSEIPTGSESEDKE